MINFSIIENCNSFFFLGIGGINMSALANYLNRKGKKVAGIDNSNNEYCQKLKKENVLIYSRFKKENLLNYDAIVYTSAIPEKNKLLLYAKENNLLLIKRSELLGYVLSKYSSSIAVSGTHGKTTTTTMLTQIFHDYKKVTSFIGGSSLAFDNFLLSDSETIITEACEYKKNFLNLSPTDTIILNIDNDHMDCYKDIVESKKAFMKFSLNSFSYVNGDDKNCAVIPANVKFGLDPSNDFYADNIKEGKKQTKFTLKTKNQKICRIKINAIGKHNVYNALASIVVAINHQIPLKSIRKSLKNYRGVKRRNEYLGQVSHTRYYADYAHHPTELCLSIDTFLKNQKKKILLIFQPHTYSRTANLMGDFIKTLDVKTDLIIYKTFPAREKYSKNGSAFSLYKNLKSIKTNVYYFEDFNKLFSFTSEYDNVLILGAGELYEEFKRFLRD